MSDEPSSSAAAAAEASSATTSASPLSNRNEAGEHAETLSESELAERRKKNRQAISKKRIEFMDDLLTGLDILVYAQLSTIYYMDCSFLRFLLRVFIQFAFLTPKPSTFPGGPRNRPFIGAILFSNTICILLHLWLNAPSAGEATRGYLHGGLAMDFIGQKGPSSKFRLVTLDLVVLFLQIVQMSADATRKNLAAVAASPASAQQQPASTEATPAESSTQQDLDAEERGVRRSGELDDIELQDLNPAETARTGHARDGVDADIDEDSERHTLLSASTMPRDDSHIFDAFNSGQIIVTDLNLMRTVKEQYRRWRAPATSASGEEQSQTLRAEFAGRVFSMRFGTDAFRRAA